MDYFHFILSLSYYNLRAHFSTMKSKLDRFLEYQIKRSRNIFVFVYDRAIPFPLRYNNIDNFQNQGPLTLELLRHFVRESILQIHSVDRSQ